MNKPDQGDDADPVREARAEVIEALERSAEIYGLNRSYGQLYGILFFEDEPISLDELVEKSGYAKSTVSTAMKHLERLHMVHRRSVPGEGKKAYYEAETDFWQILQSFLQREVQREIDVMLRALTSAEESLEGVDDERAKHALQRVRSLRRTYERSQRIVDVLTSESIGRLTDLVDRIRSE